MESGERYIKASRYDFQAQAHNRQVFHRDLIAHPWRAFVLAIGMGALAAISFFNLINAPLWIRSPWMGRVLGGAAFLISSYFLSCAVLGLRTRQSNPHKLKP